MKICCACQCDTDNLAAFDDHDEMCSLDQYRCMRLDCAWCDSLDFRVVSYHRPPMREPFDPGDLDQALDIPF